MTAHEGHQSLESLGQALSSVKLERYYATPDIRRIEVNVGNVRGIMFLPPGEGPFPAVIDLWGGMGGLVEFRAGT